jgi:cellulose biosynthesis protein BcsQ
MATSVPPARITIYNHKGGVGKTTLNVNIAAALAELGKTVLLVDSDPQCNLTSYLLSDDVVDDLLDNSERPNGRTIWTAVKPIFNEVGEVHTVKPVDVVNLALLPGDIRLSEYEEFLGEAWTNSYKRRLGGLRAIASISDLVTNICRQRAFDFVFYDTGPNIGPLNRVLLLDSDFFIVPVACDLFSVRALSTLGQTLKKWIIDARTIASLAPDGAPLLPATPQFLGYIPQRFKVYGQTMAHESARYLRQIKRRIYEDVAAVMHGLHPSLAPQTSVDPMIGQVKDFASLVQTAQREGVPLWQCSSTYADQKNAAERAFKEIASRLIATASTAGRHDSRRRR